MSAIITSDRFASYRDCFFSVSYENLHPRSGPLAVSYPGCVVCFPMHPGHPMTNTNAPSNPKAPWRHLVPSKPWKHEHTPVLDTQVPCSKPNDHGANLNHHTRVSSCTLCITQMQSHFGRTPSEPGYCTQQISSFHSTRTRSSMTMGSYPLYPH